MHFGISEGKGGLKHGSRPWLGMDIFWNCPMLTGCWNNATGSDWPLESTEVESAYSSCGCFLE